MFKPTSIVIHHTASKDGEGLDRDEIEKMHHDRGFTDIGYHFLIDKIEGQFIAVVGRPMDTMGAHCKGFNQASLGVSFVGNFEADKPDPLMIEAGLRLVLIPLCRQLGIPASQVFGHFEKGTTPTVCPGRFFPLNDVRARIARALQR